MHRVGFVWLLQSVLCICSRTMPAELWHVPNNDRVANKATNSCTNIANIGAVVVYTIHCARQLSRSTQPRFCYPHVCHQLHRAFDPCSRQGNDQDRACTGDYLVHQPGVAHELRSLYNHHDNWQSVPSTRHRHHVPSACVHCGRRQRSLRQQPC
jgi:hypothetical protein